MSPVFGVQVYLGTHRQESINSLQQQSGMKRESNRGKRRGQGLQLL